MNNSNDVKLRQQILVLETQVSNLNTKVADKKRNVIIAWLLILLEVVLTIATAGVAILAAPIFIGYLIFAIVQKSKAIKSHQETQQALVKLKSDLIANESLV